MKALITLLLAALVLTSCAQDELMIETKETQAEIEIEPDTFTPETETEPESMAVTEVITPTDPETESESMVVTETITPPEPETEIIEMNPETEVQETETEQSVQVQPDAIDTEPVIEETTPILEETEIIVEETASTIDYVIEYPINYTDDTCEITITKEWYENAWVYAAHLIYTEYDRLGTSCAYGTYNTGYETTTAAAERLGAVLAVNGCYSAPYLNYTVVRDGVTWNGSDKNLHLPAIYSSDNGLLLNTWETGGCELVGRNVAQLVDEKLLTDTFCFGPPFLANGEILVKQDDSRAQRTFIGTNGEAGDIWLVVSDGRWNDGESSGLNGYQCAAYLYSKGCQFGIPLDGGGSSTMVWNGQVLNAVGEANQRAVVDFVYFK